MSEPLHPDYDVETLRETYPDTPATRARVAELQAEIHSAPDEIAELVARGDLVDLLRGLDELDEALREALAAADRAEIVGTSAQQALTRVRLACVHQVRGEYADSNVLLTELQPVGPLGPAIGALIYQRAGENAFAQQHWSDAFEKFAMALTLREEIGLDAETRFSQIAFEAARERRGAS